MVPSRVHRFEFVELHHAFNLFIHGPNDPKNRRRVYGIVVQDLPYRHVATISVWTGNRVFLSRQEVSVPIDWNGKKADRGARS